MSQENVEIVRAAIHARNSGEIDAMLEDAAPDFEFDFSRAVGPTRGVFALEPMREFWDEFAGAWESIRWEAEEFIEVGDQVVTPTTLYVLGREGIEVEARAAWIWTFRDGKIARLTVYQSRAEALEAVGLRE
jgi:ketosteroid isomerase-like protein